jgi:hypothetical protein
MLIAFFWLTGFLRFRPSRRFFAGQLGIRFLFFLTRGRGLLWQVFLLHRFLCHKVGVQFALCKVKHFGYCFFWCFF